MKKYVLLISLVGSSIWATAQGLMGPDYYTRDAILQRQIAAQQFKATRQAMNTSITVEIPIRKQYFLEGEHTNLDFANSALYRTWRQVPMYNSTVGCKAYALDDNWLVAGAACVWNGRHTVSINGQEYETGLTEINLSHDGGLNPEYLAVGPVKINGKSTSMALFIQSRYTLLPHLILIHVPQGDSELAATVRQMPKINLLAFHQTKPTELEGGVFYVNTSRFGLNTNELRRVKSYNERTNTVTIDEHLGDLATLSNDPLFYVKDNVVYWVGINNGVMKTTPNGKWDGQPSTEFTLFTNMDLEFIKHVLTKGPMNEENLNPGYFERKIAPRLHSK